MSGRRYHLAVFGDPRPPNKDLVESGIYHPDPRLTPFDIRPSDVLLLYCTGGYRGHEKESPGIGLVLAVDDVAVKYRYVPFKIAVGKVEIDRGFEPDNARSFGNIRFSTFWLFELSAGSFERTLGSDRLYDLRLAAPA